MRYYCCACWASWRAPPCAFVCCAGVTRLGHRCAVNSLQEHAGADPLREGQQYCAQHGQATACASCGDADDLRKDAHDGAWYCKRCWDEWEQDDPLEGVAAMIFVDEGPETFRAG